MTNPNSIRPGLAWLAAVALVLTTATESAVATTPDSPTTVRAPGVDAILRTLSPAHPRLILDPDALENIRKWIDQDPVAARIHQKVLADAARALKEKPPAYELRDGRRLLYVSQEVLQRVATLAYAYRMTGRKDYVKRAWADLHAAAGFKDWNPAHFLDTAVMTCALAIGYDWLWDQWTPDQRLELREAIVRLGLEPAMKVYSGKSGWHLVDYNWNQVCNGGIAMGALAVADEEPEIASKILSHAIASIPRAMNAYAPDGAGREGAGYWDFGSKYNIMLLASLDSALGTDFGLGTIDGFKQSGDYQIYMSGAGRMVSISAIATARRFPRRSTSGWAGTMGFRGIRGSATTHCARERAETCGICCGSIPATGGFGFGTAARQAFPRRGGRVDAGFMEGRHGFTVAMQGGSNRWTHRHFDLGSFILEADGVRWIIDSGKESETYQRHVNHTPREDFYRVRAEGHNTLVIDPDKGPGQSADGEAAFTTFVSKPEVAIAELDMTHAYQESAQRVGPVV